jgi:magnesium chelatase subunit I
VGTVPGLAKVLGRLGLGDAPTRGEAASGVEFVLEGLHLSRRLSKDLTEDGRTVYGSR